eukprot:CAMPEP_0184862108 /NCGR_PEP_ID=MMETSP0580-20130426/6629_1 /TAXON_ID=1118495 /ORGANISM="Dactyliosolen fragilissimus" /LENGTH=645 /DNA_ID=CAMNT_0027359837 /DNA_START=63 /DNA_END=1997 /DNA_ORIENTATION=-
MLLNSRNARHTSSSLKIKISDLRNRHYCLVQSFISKDDENQDGSRSKDKLSSLELFSNRKIPSHLNTAKRKSFSQSRNFSPGHNNTYFRDNPSVLDVVILDKKFSIIRREFTKNSGDLNSISRNNISEKDEIPKSRDKEDKTSSDNIDKANPTIFEQRTDKDFADYLLSGKGGVSDVNEDLLKSTPSIPSRRKRSELTNEILEGTRTNLESEEKVSSNETKSNGTLSGDEWFNQLHVHQKINPPLTSLAENEINRNLENQHRNDLERSRTKRLMTVRRALGGNLIITFCKLGAFVHSGSSAMMSEFIHSVVDCGNQALLLIGLRDAGNKADRKHQYGYGKSIYFWALVSALGTFFLGAGVSITQALPELIHGPSLQEITWHVWSVLGISFAVDGYVLTKTVQEILETKPKNETFWKHVWSIRDPATLAILLEDGAACTGILIALGGISLTHFTEMPVFDALAGVGISGLLASMGLILVRVNHRFLLGQSVDPEIIRDIEQILLNRRSIEALDSVQTQWTGPDTFSYKAEVDFDGTFLAAKLIPRYQKEFAEAKSTLDQDLRVLLSWYAEDVMRTVEREVRHIEAEIRKKYPGAQHIELEPMGKDRDRFAIDDGMEAQLKRIEIEALNRYLKSLYQKDSSNKRLSK